MNNFDFNSLNESNGVKEFDNKIFEMIIKSIPKQIIQPSNKFTNFIIADQPVQFYKLGILLNLNWIKNLQIFYTYNDTFYNFIHSYGISPNLELNPKEHIPLTRKMEDMYCEQNNCIIHSPILLYIDKSIDDFGNFYSKIIYHEIAHLYDRLKCESNTGLDLVFAHHNNINHDHYQMIKMRLINNIYTLNDLKYIINEFIKYTNFSESHAYTESTYFDMLLYMENINKISWKFNNDYSQKNIIKNISNEIEDIYDYNNIIVKLIENYNIIKRKYKQLYLNEINKSYNKNFISVNDLLKYLYKHLYHIKYNIDKNFSYFYKLFDVKKQLNETKLYRKRINEIKYNVSENPYILEYVLIGNEIKKHYIRY